MGTTNREGASWSVGLYQTISGLTMAAWHAEDHIGVILHENLLDQVTTPFTCKFIQQ